ncbi:MAG: hypothetical protein DSZ29_02130 [Aquificaceae bacterium]|nr:MAG: hypothetical protein DSZ29_02130 [Aquificaceae bacterium]
MISNLRLRSILGNFEIEEKIIDYHSFIARFYNFCLEEGMTAGKIVPSRAFCSDESQGLPIILISKHFGAFPFDHGLVGGVMATSRHSPHAHHGQDLAIIQASHVGYDTSTETFGIYRRLQTSNQEFSPNCGMIDHTLEWYLNEYKFASKNILLHRTEEGSFVTIDNQLLSQKYDEGLFINLRSIIEFEELTKEMTKSVQVLSTSKRYRVSKNFKAYLRERNFLWPKKPRAIGKYLKPNLFEYKRNIDNTHQVEKNIYPFIPWIVTSSEPMLSAAEINIQVEFDRGYRSIVREESYHGRNLIYISGLNIDYSPDNEHSFAQTQFVPWAAYVQHANGEHTILEQDELFNRLMQCSAVNPDQVSLDSIA